MKIQFTIQFVATCTIHCSQGLTFDYLTFDSTSVTNHGLTYITLSKVCSKGYIYSISNKSFQVEYFFKEKMFQLTTNALNELAIIPFKSYYSKFTIIQSLNICSLKLHLNYIVAYSNLSTSRILCLNEKNKMLICEFKYLQCFITNKNSMFCHVMMNMKLRYFMITMCH
jgi:hypothetical protein